MPFSWMRTRKSASPRRIGRAAPGARPADVARFRDKPVGDSPQHNPVYAAMIHTLDENIGRIMTRLDGRRVFTPMFIVLLAIGSIDRVDAATRVGDVHRAVNDDGGGLVADAIDDAVLEDATETTSCYSLEGPRAPAHAARAALGAMSLEECAIDRNPASQ